MDLFEAISRRHSYRGPFLDRPVPREDPVSYTHLTLPTIYSV